MTIDRVTVVICMPTNGNQQFIFGVFASEDYAREYVELYGDKDHKYRFSDERVLVKQ